MSRLLSLIIPVYNEEGSLPALYKKIMQNLQELIVAGSISAYEIWFVSDGSTDKSEQIIKKFAAKDSAVRKQNRCGL